MGINGSREENNHALGDNSIPSRPARYQPLSEPIARNTTDESSTYTTIQQPITEANNESVPTVFKWEHGGKQVYITGTFNNWERQIPMHRSGNDFTYIHNLKKGKHAFKFIVDDEWRYAPDQPTIADIDGQINNFIDVSEFTPYEGDNNFFSKSKERKVADDEFRQVIPDLDDYTKE